MAGLPAAFADEAAEREEIAGYRDRPRDSCYQQQFDRIILVGDSDCDVATAARLGVGFVGIAAYANAASGSRCATRAPKLGRFRHIHEGDRKASLRRY